MLFGEDAARKRALKGATILSFDCRGCMASDHQLMWVGVVEDFEPTRYAGEAAKVKVIKRGHNDIRDGYLGHEIEPIANPSLQELAPKLWAVYR